MYKRSQKLWKRNTQVVYYNPTNYFFEREEECGLVRFGHCKEGRPLPLVQPGLFMDHDGFPLAMCIEPGNTAETSTLKPMEQILKEVSYKAYPSALVDKIDVDCGNLHLGDCIRVKDLEIAKNKDISIMTNPESIIVNVIAVHNNAGDDTADDTEETAEK